MITGSRVRSFLVDNVDLAAATGVDDARWEPFQIALLDDLGTFRIDNKSRQIAWSWTAAAAALADAILNRRDSIFVSINREEAQEKIRYARQIYESLRITGLPKVKSDSMQRLELDNGARLTSFPGRQPRGRARSNLYLDEFAHVYMANTIYTAALPILAKGGVRVRIGSSPFGAQGIFWEIYTQSMRPYPDYTRNITPWWRTYAFCTDPLAAEYASRSLLPDQLVEKYGRPRIRQIFDNFILEDFLQEFCCVFVDESTAWITWQEIKNNESIDHLWHHATATAGHIDQAMEAIDRLAKDIAAGKVERILCAGLDVGRTRDASEFAIVGMATTGQLPLRLMITMAGLDFDAQRDIIDYAMRRIPITQLLIDRNGIGMNLAENISRRYPSKAYGVNFTNESKRAWATDSKMLMQKREAPIPIDKELHYQIHSIKRQRTGTGLLRFDTEASEKHHADKFWAWALALSAAYRERINRDLGYRQPGHVSFNSM